MRPGASIPQDPSDFVAWLQLDGGVLRGADVKDMLVGSGAIDKFDDLDEEAQRRGFRLGPPLHLVPIASASVRRHADWVERRQLQRLAEEGGPPPAEASSKGEDI